MKCARCGRCCKETMMEISEKDAQRLKDMGFEEEGFSIVGEDGILRLRNVDGRCFFLSEDGNTCKVYDSRPLGCDIYPVNCDEEGRVFLDEFCQARVSVSKGEMRKKGISLKRHLKAIDEEARRRRKSER